MKFTLLFPKRKNRFFHILCIGLLTAAIASSCSPLNPEDERKDPPPRPPEEPLTVTVDDVLTLDPATGKLRKGGKDYYGAGVNYYDAFYRVVIDGTHSDVSYKQGFRILQEKGIPFVRFSVLAFYPNDLRYYVNHESDYFAKLDAFVATAKEHNVGLIPSFFWNYAAPPDFLGEPVGTWANLDEPGNKTNAFMEKYVEKMVKRYGNNPAIWAWEFSNEINLKTDPARRTFEQQPWMYPSVGSGGFPATRTFVDTLGTDGLVAALAKFQTLVREQEDKLDLPHRAVFSGNGVSGGMSYSRYHYGTRVPNTKEQYEEMMILKNGNLGTVTIHPYLNHESDFGASMRDIIAGAKAKCDQEKRALFLGEFGVNQAYEGDKEAKWREYVEAIKENDVQLSALWVFDTLGRESGYMSDWVVTPTFRSYQLDGIIEINDYFKDKYK